MHRTANQQHSRQNQAPTRQRVVQRTASPGGHATAPAWQIVSHQGSMASLPATLFPAQSAEVANSAQRSSGNRLFTSMLQGMHLPAGRSLQRCGDQACGCSPEEQLDHAVQQTVTQSDPATLQTALDQSAPSGESLDAATRQQVEPELGVDLSGVRVHTDAGSDRLARSLDAEAFTTGSDIYFRKGRYNPRSQDGLHLLAHELTHVKQQSQGRVSGGQGFGGLTVTPANDPFEAEAEATASRIVSASNAAPASHPVNTGQRKSIQARRGGPIQRRVIRKEGAQLAGWGGPGSFITFDPKAQLFRGGQLQEGRTYESGNREAFNVAPGQGPGTVRILVDMAWQQFSQPGGTTPGNVPGGVPGIDQICNSPIPIPGIPPNVREQICQAGRNPGSVIDSMTGPALCGLLTVLVPPVGAGCFAALATVGLIGLIFGFDPLDEFRKLLKKILGLGPGNNQPPPQPQQPVKTGEGTARAILDTSFDFNEQRQIQLFGPPAIGSTAGTGLALESPVQSSKDSTPFGGMINMAPNLRSEGSVNIGGVSQPMVFGFQENFIADLVKPPTPTVSFFCGHEAGPFHIGSDRFMNPDEEETELFQFVNNLSPALKSKVRDGTQIINVVGRASTTGNVTFNRELSRKRADKVATILRDFAGSDSHIRSFAMGEFEAETPPNTESAGERRADVVIEGTMEVEEGMDTGCLCDVTTCGLPVLELEETQV